MFLPIVIIVILGGVVLVASLIFDFIQGSCPVDEEALRLHHLSKLNIAVNDIVSHIDYDPWLMRVVRFTDDGYIVCTWQNSDGKIYEHPFSPFAIKAPPKVEGL